MKNLQIAQEESVNALLAGIVALTNILDDRYLVFTSEMGICLDSLINQLKASPPHR